MIKFLKNYLINIIFGIIAFALLYAEFNFYLDWKSDLSFWIVEGSLIALAFYLPKKNKDNNDEKKEYKPFTIYKVSLIIIIILIAVYLGIQSNNASGWNAIGYGLLAVYDLIMLIPILAINFIIRIYYRIKYNQVFAKGSISNLILIIILVFVSLCVLLIVNLF